MEFESSLNKTSGDVHAVIQIKNIGFGDFPGGSVVKNLPPNAENEVPGWRTKILHPTGLLSPRGNYFACAIKPRTDPKKRVWDLESDVSGFKSQFSHLTTKFLEPASCIKPISGPRL